MINHLFLLFRFEKCSSCFITHSIQDHSAINPRPVTLTRQLSASKLNPSSAAAKRLQSSNPKPPKLISPSNIATVFPNMPENEAKTDKQLTGRRISPKVNPKEFSNSESHSRHSTRSESPRTMETNKVSSGRRVSPIVHSKQYENNYSIRSESPRMTETSSQSVEISDAGWANFQDYGDDQKATARGRINKDSSSNEQGRNRGNRSDEKNWGFASFDGGSNCGLNQNHFTSIDEKGLSEFGEYFSNESCGFPAFRSSPVGQCSTSRSQSQEESLEPLRNDQFHPFPAENANTFDERNPTRLMGKLKIGGVAKAFLSNARFAFTSCNSNAQSAV